MKKDFYENAVLHNAKNLNIDIKKIDPKAIKIIKRLNKLGYDAYIVGGAIRDIAMNLEPRDFDVVSSASPKQIRKAFRNSRVIGKRFKLVHIFFEKGKYIEVSTFRGERSKNFKNQYGTIEEDWKKRDFSINALYYSPNENMIIDYVQGVQNIKDKKIKNVIPIERIFKEDPIRIFRLIKYMSKLDFEIDPSLLRRLKLDKKLLKDTSYSRLTEEFYKILKSPNFEKTYNNIFNYNILKYISYDISCIFILNPLFKIDFFKYIKKLDNLDEFKNERKEYVAVFLFPFIGKINQSYLASNSKLPNKDEMLLKLKRLVYPLVFANHEIEFSIEVYIKKITSNCLD